MEIMKSLLEAAKFMSILSIISMGDSLNSLVIYIVIAGLIYWAGHQCMKLVNKVDVVHDYTLTHRSDHVTIAKDLQRVDCDVKNIKEDFEEMKAQLLKFDIKLDKMMSEIKKDHHKPNIS